MIPRIYIRDIGDKTIDVLDAGDYFNDSLQRFLAGKASIFTFSIVKKEDDYKRYLAGKKISFRYEGEDFWLNAMVTEQNETTLSVTAVSLNLELNNEKNRGFKADKAMSFEEYFNRIINFERTLKIGINEVSAKKIKHEWEGTATNLARLYSLANVFDAEIEFDTALNDDGSLKQIVVNIYKKHDENNQGLGQDRRNETFRFGDEIKTVRKNEDIRELYTAIHPLGKEGLTIASIEKEVFDADGNLLYCTYKTSKPHAPQPEKIYAVQAREQFPSTLSGGDRWLVHETDEMEYESAEALYGYALSELKKNSVPQTTWEIEGYITARIGDTVRIADDGYKPELLLEARISEQTISFTQPSTNKSTFTNVTEKKSQVSADLLQKMQDLINANKKYDCQIVSSAGIIFKNGEGETMLTARILDGIADVAESFTIRWSKDGVFQREGIKIPVKAADINQKAVYRFEAFDSEGILKGGYEVTVTNVDDGKDSYRVEILSSQGNIFKNGVIKTVLNAVVYKGEKNITDQINAARFRWNRASFDSAGDLIWNENNSGGRKSIEVDEDDVYVKATFSCEVDLQIER